MVRSIFAMTLFVATSSFAQVVPPSKPRETSAFSMLDGVWSGSATIVTRTGSKTIRHTERVGPMLNGGLRVIEGKSYNPDGSDAGFNAFAIISPNETGGYDFRSYAQGHSGTFPIVATGSGFSWSIPAGPSSIHYTAVVKDGVWHEDGMMERAGAPTVAIFKLDLKYVSTTDWPAAGAVHPTQ